MNILKNGLLSVVVLVAFISLFYVFLFTETCTIRYDSLERSYSDCSEVSSNGWFFQAPDIVKRMKVKDTKTYFRTHTVRLPDIGKSNGLIFENICHYPNLNGIEHVYSGPTCCFKISSFSGKYENIKTTLSCWHHFGDTDSEHAQEPVAGYRSSNNGYQYAIYSIFKVPFSRKFSFTDFDHDGDLDLIYTGDMDFNAIAWENDRNGRWNNESRIIIKENHFKIMLVVFSRAVILWVVYCVFAIPVMFWTRLSMLKRVIIIFICPTPIIYNCITCNGSVLFFTVVMFFSIYLISYFAFLKNLWRRRANSSSSKL